MTTTGQLDRVSYSYSFKTSEEFNSRAVHLSYSTDAAAGETPEQAMERARAFVHAQCERDTRRSVSGPAPATSQAPARSARSQEVFDPGNPDHVEEARVLLERARVGVNRQRFFFTTLLPGKPMESLGDFIQDEVNDFARQRANREPYNQRRGGGGRRY